MLIAHLSDFHLFTKTPETSLVRPDIIDVVRRIIADVSAFRPAIDAIMLTGDLADGGTDEDYALLKEVLSPLAMPVFAIPGNHDKRGAFRRAFESIFPFEDGPFLQYEASFRGIRILALDTLIENSVKGGLCPQRLDWIEQKLAKPFYGQTMILMHHPPHLSGIRFLDNIALVEGSDRLGSIVSCYPGQVRILCGHIHRPSQALWNGVFTAIAGSPAFKIELDLKPHDDEPALVDEPYAYFIHRLDEAKGFSVHPRYVRIPRL